MDLHEMISDNELKLIQPSDKIHNTNIDKSLFNFKKVYNQYSGHKPNGLWYSFGKQWIEWCNDEMPEWIKKYNYRVLINSDKIKKIENEEDLIEFHKEYSISIQLYYGGPKETCIDWPKVCLQYDGIEIANSQPSLNQITQKIFPLNKKIKK